MLNKDKKNPNSAASLRTLKPFSTQETKEGHMHMPHAVLSSSVLAVPSVENGGSGMHVGVTHS